MVTSPGGAMLGSANFVVNCPVLGCANKPLTAPQAPRIPGMPNTGSGGDFATQDASESITVLVALSLATVLGGGLALARRWAGQRQHRAR